MISQKNVFNCKFCNTHLLNQKWNTCADCSSNLENERSFLKEKLIKADQTHQV